MMRWRRRASYLGRFTLCTTVTELHISVDLVCGTTAAKLQNSVDLLRGTTTAELQNSVDLLCGATAAELPNSVDLLGTLRSTTAKLWYGGCNRKRLGRLRRLPPKLELIKFCVVRQSQTRCKQIRLGFKFFGCGMSI